MKPSLLRKILWALLSLVGLELVLRLFGFGQIPLYEPSSQYDYALVPNQDIKRFGNRFFINEEGMRSQSLKDGEWRVLKFGDSVLNGGIGTDQSELASEILEARCEQEYPNTRVLNISAGSWGPDNAFAWMQSHGDFDAKILVLLFGSEDWQDQMICRNVVGHVSFYPDRQPFLAITDVFEWAMSRYLVKTEWDKLPKTPGCEPHEFPHNSGWDNFIAYAKSKGLPLIVYHHADKSENENGTWNSKGQQLETYLSAQHIEYISGLEAGFENSDYRDDVHPNAAGQAKIAEAIYPVLMKTIDDERE